MKPDEKLRYFLEEHRRLAENGGTAIPRGEHLTDADFIRLIKAVPQQTAAITSNGEEADPPELSVASEHLIGCDLCLTQFEEFYDFFAPVEVGELAAGTAEIAADWKKITNRIVAEKPSKSFWASLFPVKGFKLFPALGWVLAALLLIYAVATTFVARRAQNSEAELASERQSEKQEFEARLKTLEDKIQSGETIAQDKNRLETEKSELQQRLAELETKIELAKTQNQPVRGTPPSPGMPEASPAKIDNSLVAINTPIYDVFPSGSPVRGKNGDAKNKLTIPKNARNAVLILNSEAPTDISVYQGELVSDAGKIVWRGAGLKRDGAGNFTLTFSRSALKNGNYRLTLSGKSSAGVMQKIADYPISVQDQ